MQTTDKEIIQNRFAGNFESYNRLAIVQRQVAARLGCLIQKTKKQDFNRILEIGCGTGFLTQEILSNYSVKEYVLNDLADSAFNEVQKYTGNLNYGDFNFISGDAEETIFPDQLDAVFSASSIQWFQNIERFLKKMHALLNKNGIIAISTFGKNNFKEIKTTLNVGLKYKSLSELCNLISPDYTIIHAEEWTQEESFQGPHEVLKHMKLTGVNGVSKNPFTKGTLQQFDEKYRNLYSDKDKCVLLSFHPIIIIAKKK